jgi:hypothetical protein
MPLQPVFLNLFVALTISHYP